MKKLDQIVTIHSGIYAQPSPEGNAKYLQGKWFDEYGNLSDVIKPELKLDARLEKHLLYDGDILFAAKGTRNYAVVYRQEWGLAIASSTFMVIKIKENMRHHLDPEYLAWFINHPSTQMKLQDMARGSFIQSITKDNLKEVFVNFPNLETQHAILQVHELYVKKKRLEQRLYELNGQLVEGQLMNIAKQDKP